ncbi:S8 family peptidase, partial [Novosphingobium sp. PASSN1]|uniref:S8 family peptidase n=1 Tax=Novosphingobium sp. PASSN1 TaxID=2015561 RepID=UPI000BDD56AC
SNSNTFWGSAVTTRLGGTFQSSFQTPLFARYGISATSAQNLAALAPDKRGAFFVDLFDGLNGFTGFDQVDNWMLQTKWSPHLSNVQGRGAGVTIGLVDTRLSASEADIMARVSYNGGATTYSNVHGTAVASLLVAAHNGRNIMGIAPGANIATYNPYDASATTSWANASRAIDAVAGAGASVINLSLGEPGVAFSPKWDTALLQATKATKVVAVIAAGNDGLTQTKDIMWTQPKPIAFLVVGSVDANNVISTFSNRPGNACLKVLGVCNTIAAFGQGGPLRNYFLVAPGENVLASNGQGGVARYSGTSLAAPQVTGAVALLQGRWPWLKAFPLETAQIILRSAKDLGVRGVDPVYGWGLLDVEASQAPLNFNTLIYYTVRNGVSTARTVTAVRSSTNRAAWAAQGAYISAFEMIGGTSRDFILPIAPSLVGAKVGTLYFQDFVYNRLVAWASAPALANVGGHLTLSDTGRAAALPVAAGFKVALRSRLVPVGPSERAARNFRAENSLTIGDVRDRFSITVGQGANTLNALQSGFGLESDYAPLDGGVNPIAGFASGGAHARASVAVVSGLQLTFGNSRTRRDPLDGAGRSIRDGFGRDGLDRDGLGSVQGRYVAAAQSVRLDYAPRTWLSLSASLTNLTEAEGLLGVRSETANGLIGASRTRAITLGTSLEPVRGLLVSASGTRSNSRSRDGAAALQTSAGGIEASAFAFAIARSGVVRGADQLRLSVSQPLAIMRGGIDLTTLGVIDRETGALGAVKQSLSVRERARLVGEVNYGVPLQAGLGELTLFGRSDMRPEARNAQGVALGARIRMVM